ncbi:hypothetical protein [Enterococcus crotali]
MKKEIWYKYLYAAISILTIAFIIRLGVDIAKQTKITWIFILDRAIDYLIPIILLFIFSKFCRSKYNIK